MHWYSSWWDFVHFVWGHGFFIWTKGRSGVEGQKEWSFPAKVLEILFSLSKSTFHPFPPCFVPWRILTMFSMALVLWLVVAISQWEGSAGDKMVKGQKGQGIYSPDSLPARTWVGNYSLTEGHTSCWIFRSLLFHFFLVSLVLGTHSLHLSLQA